MAQQPQADPWEVEAAKMHAAPAGGSAAPAGNDASWKIWQQGGGDPSSTGGEGFLSSAADSSGLSTIGRAFMHPIDTANNISKAILPMGQSAEEYDSNPVVQGAKGIWANTRDNVAKGIDDYKKTGLSEETRRDFGRAVPVVGPALAKAQMQHDAGNDAGMAGTMTGLVGGALVPEVGVEGLRAAGPALERGGLGVVNHALEATPKIMKYGQNPARGAIEEGVVPALSKFSAERNLETATPAAGQRVSDAVHGTTRTIPKAAIANSVEQPIMDAGEIMSGFGGGKNTQPLNDLWASTEQPAPGASGPVYGPSAPPNVSAPDLWASVKNLDRNTRFNPDPEVEGVNEVRRDMRGGLRSNLEEAVPDLKPLSQRYGDLRAAEDSLSRSSGRGTPLSKMRDLATFPIETTAGAGMYRAGKAFQDIPNRFLPRNATPVFANREDK
jgi:hypothetical protein